MKSKDYFFYSDILTEMNTKTKCRLLYLTVIIGYILICVYAVVKSLSLPYTGEMYYQQEGE